jgi:hypothetical protein
MQAMQPEEGPPPRYQPNELIREGNTIYLKPKLRSRKEIEQARTEFADNHPIAVMLDWILGKTEQWRHR